MKELFELLQINSELFGPNQPQTSSNSDPERISTPQPSEGQESSSYESQYDGRLANMFCFIRLKIKKEGLFPITSTNWYYNKNNSKN